MTENKRFEYWKDSDTAYDTKIKYGQYFRIIDKKDMVCLLNEQEEIITEQKEYLTRMGQGNHLKIIMEQKERIKELEQFINKLTTDGAGRIYLANGYAYKVSAVLTDYDGDVDD